MERERAVGRVLLATAGATMLALNLRVAATPVAVRLRYKKLIEYQLNIGLIPVLLLCWPNTSTTTQLA